jgi:hypothetical protein
MDMPLKSTTNFIDSLVTFCKNASDNVLDATATVFPRWKAPEELDNGTFEKEAEQNYLKEISLKKEDQDLEKLMNKGNDYYFSMMVKKAHRLYSRTRIESVAINKSLEKGFGDEANSFLTTKYKLLGDKVDPNDD